MKHVNIISKAGDFKAGDYEMDATSRPYGIGGGITPHQGRLMGGYEAGRLLVAPTVKEQYPYMILPKGRTSSGTARHLLLKEKACLLKKFIAIEQRADRVVRPYGVGALFIHDIAKGENTSSGAAYHLLL